MYTPIPDSELDAIEARVAMARSGPWSSFVEGRDHDSGSSFIMIGDEESRSVDIELIGATSADQDFIAAARQDVPTLLAEVYALREMLLARD